MLAHRLERFLVVFLVDLVHHGHDHAAGFVRLLKELDDAFVLVLLLGEQRDDDIAHGADILRHFPVALVDGVDVGGVEQHQMVGEQRRFHHEQALVDIGLTQRLFRVIEQRGGELGHELAFEALGAAPRVRGEHRLARGGRARAHRAGRLVQEAVQQR